MIVIAAAVIWLALVATRKRTLMLAGAAILAAAWLGGAAGSQPADWFRRAKSPPLHSDASMIARTQKGSCASVAPGMSAEEVKSRVGEPDEVRGDEETRGPGASMLLYRGSRCAVHLLDGRIEFIE
jgi:hypothetical protein